MKRVNYFLLLFLFVFCNQLNAQKPAGIVNMKFDHARVVSYFIEIQYKNYTNFDDTLTSWGESTSRIPYLEKTILPDSVCILKYVFQDIFSTDGIFTNGFLFMYNHQQDTLSLYTSITINTAINPANYATALFSPPLVYRSPKQNLSFNLFKNQPFIWEYDTNGYAYTPDKAYTDWPNLNAKTGIVSIKAGDTNHPDFFTLYAKTLNRGSVRRSTQPLAITLITDSTLPGFFVFDSGMEDQDGFLWYAPTGQASEGFSFQYIDTTADSIDVNTYSPLFNLGSEVLTTVVKHQDTFDISVSFPLSEGAKQYLPTPINFEINPYTQGPLKPRLVSVAVGKKPTVGLTEAKSGFSPISIYPNPTSGDVSIVSASKIADVRMVNTLGITCYPTVTSPQQINLDHLPNGLYYLTIETTEGLSSHKIMVQHKN